jgi:hypothetical protein
MHLSSFFISWLFGISWFLCLACYALALYKFFRLEDKHGKYLPKKYDNRIDFKTLKIMLKEETDTKILLDLKTLYYSKYFLITFSILPVIIIFILMLLPQFLKAF